MRKLQTPPRYRQPPASSPAEDGRAQFLPNCSPSRAVAERALQGAFSPLSEQEPCVDPLLFGNKPLGLEPIKNRISWDFISPSRELIPTGARRLCQLENFRITNQSPVLKGPMFCPHRHTGVEGCPNLIRFWPHRPEEQVLILHAYLHSYQNVCPPSISISKLYFGPCPSAENSTALK